MTEPGGVQTWIDERGMQRCNATVRTHQPKCATLVLVRLMVTMIAPEGVTMAEFDGGRQRFAKFDWGGTEDAGR